MRLLPLLAYLYLKYFLSSLAWSWKSRFHFLGLVSYTFLKNFGGWINRSSHRRSFIKKVFLNISQNSQESTCVRVVLIKLHAEPCNFIKKMDLVQVVFCEFWEIFKKSFLIEHLQRLLLNHVWSWLSDNLTLSWRRYLSYRNQSIGLLSKLIYWFLYERDLCYEKVHDNGEARYFYSKFIFPSNIYSATVNYL